MKISVIIIAKNAEKVIADCLKSVRQLADEIIVIDDQSDDKTVQIAKEMGVSVYIHKMKDFADQREFGLKKAQGEWALYVDADERVSQKLKEEIQLTINPVKSSLRSDHGAGNQSRQSRGSSIEASGQSTIVIYKIPRKNYYLGNFEWPMVEKIERLFLKKALKGWKGAIHESPIIEGKTGELKNYLLHYTHQDLSSMVKKTNEWSEIEAKVLYQSGHPKMSWWRFLRIMVTKFWQSYIGQGGWRIGVPGLIESAYQAFSYFIIYAKLWERQKDENRNS